MEADQYQILEKRARLLALQRQEEEKNGKEEVVVFGYGEENWAILAQQVAAIFPATSFWPVPDAPRWLLGLANLRHQVVPVANINRLLGLEGEGENHYLIWCSWPGQQLALAASNLRIVRTVIKAEEGQEEWQLGLVEKTVPVIELRKLWQYIKQRSEMTDDALA